MIFLMIKFKNIRNRNTMKIFIYQLNSLNIVIINLYNYIIKLKLSKKKLKSYFNI